jgi:8-oxo-dGTP pyrophosphatase MutT (NUDIX family)
MNITFHILGKRIRITDTAPPVAAAGILFVAGDEVLLLQRAADDQNHPAAWDLPGGTADVGETAQKTAIREAREECGISMDFEQYIDALEEVDHSTNKDTNYTTFMLKVDKFKPKLSHEHDDYGWFQLDKLPQNVHPALRITLDALVLELP